MPIGGSSTSPSQYRTAVLAALSAGTAAVVVAGTAQAKPADAPGAAERSQKAAAPSGVVGIIQPHPVLQVDLDALTAPDLGPKQAQANTGQARGRAKQARGNAGKARGNAKKGPPAKFKTGDLPRGRAVPLHDFRVGPLYGRVGGPHTGGVHSGLDMGADHGAPMYAIAAGKVEVAGWQGAAGLSVTIVTQSGKRILYGHMSRLNVTAGQKVAAGDRIGAVGSTGNSTGPHLHLGVHRPNGSSMDPLVWLGVSVPELAKHGRD